VSVRATADAVVATTLGHRSYKNKALFRMEIFNYRLQFGAIKQISITLKFVREGRCVGTKCKCEFSGQKKSTENAGFEICCSY